jgi:nucleotide-binding universal stress UspA family protein
VFQRILIPLDGSTTAEQVLAFIGGFAAPAETQLVLVRVLETLRLAPTRASPALMELFAALKQQYECYLHGISAKLQRKGYQVKIIVGEGDAASIILKTAEISGAELITMSTHGRSGPVRWILGSVAERVLQAASGPVLLVRGQAGSPKERLQRILVPLDGSALAEQALPYAKQIAQATGASFHLLEVLSPADVELEVSHWPPDAEADPAYGRRIRLARSYLQKLAEQLQTNGIDCTYRVMRGDPRTAICSIARRSRIDMVVMSTHGHTGLSRWVLGSVANQVIHRADCPVLVVRNRPG